MTFWQPTNPRHPPIFSTPDEMYARCCEYFEWVRENPIYEKKIFQFNGGIVNGETEKPRAMTIKALCIHMGCSVDAWANYRKREGFSEVCELVDSIIYTQKFELAAADLLNVNLIARDLGLREKIENTGSVTHINYSPEDYKRAQKELESKLDDLD
jgi:hypothetical protein